MIKKIMKKRTTFLFCFNSFIYSTFLKGQNKKPYQAQIRFTPERKKGRCFQGLCPFTWCGLKIRMPQPRALPPHQLCQPE